jgi:hypothetical protein
MSCSDHTTHRGDSAAGRSSVAGVFVLVLALALGLVAAPSALAGKPTGEYAVFKDCPLGTTGVNSSSTRSSTRCSTCRAPPATAPRS